MPNTSIHHIIQKSSSKTRRCNRGSTATAASAISTYQYHYHNSKMRAGERLPDQKPEEQYYVTQERTSWALGFLCLVALGSAGLSTQTLRRGPKAGNPIL